MLKGIEQLYYVRVRLFCRRLNPRGYWNVLDLIGWDSPARFVLLPLHGYHELQQKQGIVGHVSATARLAVAVVCPGSGTAVRHSFIK
jgi:hypothetical protein